MDSGWLIKHSPHLEGQHYLRGWRAWKPANVLGAVHKKRRPTVPSHLSLPSELDHELSSHPEDFQKLFHLFLFVEKNKDRYFQQPAVLSETYGAMHQTWTKFLCSAALGGHSLHPILLSKHLSINGLKVRQRNDFPNFEC